MSNIISFNPFGTGQCLSTEWSVRQSDRWNVSIPLEQGNVFRHGTDTSYEVHHCKFQSLWNRAMSFDSIIEQEEDEFLAFQSLWNRAMSFDTAKSTGFQSVEEVSIPLEQGNVFRRSVATATTARFQSLWNRAMSFDKEREQALVKRIVSIPLEQGNVFRR